jgi:hypothetical protein
MASYGSESQYRCRFRLKSLLMAMTVAALGFAWLATRFADALRQRDAVASVRALGGSSFYDHEFWELNSTVGSIGGANKPQPTWIREVIGVDFFDRLCKAELNSTLRDVDLTGIHDLRHLEILRLTGGGVVSPLLITDVGLESLSDLRRLKVLELPFAPHVTDAGLHHLTGLSELRLLNLGASGITDVGLAEIGRLRNLRELHLWGTEVTDNGLTHLRNLTNLKVLFVNRTRVTAEGRQELQRWLPRTSIR